jgi:hypothetical protein
MVNISNVDLKIFEGPPADEVGKALIQVGFQIQADHHDAEHGQAYRELVYLIGDDRGEGGTATPLPISPFWDGIEVFTTSETGFVRTREAHIDISALDEDPGPVIRRDEIRAVVTMTPIPPSPVTRESNLITRGGPVVGHG